MRWCTRVCTKRRYCCHLSSLTSFWLFSTLYTQKLRQMLAVRRHRATPTSAVDVYRNLPVINQCFIEPIQCQSQKCSAVLNHTSPIHRVHHKKSCYNTNTVDTTLLSFWRKHNMSVAMITENMVLLLIFYILRTFLSQYFLICTLPYKIVKIISLFHLHLLACACLGNPFSNMKSSRHLLRLFSIQRSKGDVLATLIDASMANTSFYPTSSDTHFICTDRRTIWI